MICGLCHHEAVEWVGDLLNPSGTVCKNCGGRNCQVLEDEEEGDEDAEDMALFDADPDCAHVIYCAPGGGVKCRHCPGWFCY